MLFVILAIIAFPVKFLWIKTQFPIDFTLTFFGMFIITTQIGYFYAVLFFLITDISASIIIQRTYNAMSAPGHIILLLIVGIASFLEGGNLLLTGSFLVTVYYLAATIFQYFIGFFNAVSVTRNITGILFTVLYLWRLWPVLQYIL
jgi:hypothetical protein